MNRINIIMTNIMTMYADISGKFDADAAGVVAVIFKMHDVQLGYVIR